MSQGLAAMLRDAMQEYRKMRNEGVDHDDGCAGLECVLRQALPMRVDMTECHACDDTGLVVKETTAYMAGSRLRTAPPGHSIRVGYPCTCVEGKRFQVRGQGSAEDELAQVGKAKRGWARAGRG